jgi:hypothetical protein
MQRVTTLGRRYFPSDYHGFGQDDNMIEPVLKVAEFWIGVGNREYHRLSHPEIRGGKRISQHGRASASDKIHQRRYVRLSIDVITISNFR